MKRKQDAKFRKMPSSLTKEGSADERDGSINIIACNISALSYIDNHEKK